MGIQPIKRIPTYSRERSSEPDHDNAREITTATDHVRRPEEPGTDKNEEAIPTGRSFEIRTTYLAVATFMSNINKAKSVVVNAHTDCLNLVLGKRGYVDSNLKIIVFCNEFELHYLFE